MRPPQIVFDALSFAVAHIFFWPVAALAVEWVFLHFCESLGLRYSWCFTAVIGLNALYAVASYGGKPEFRGDRFTQWFTTFWIGCHSYFPVRTLMWDGAAYADAPNEGHDKVFDVDKRTFVFAMHPHGAIPLGAAVFRPQIARWQKINAALRVGVASAAFVSRWGRHTRSLVCCVGVPLPACTCYPAPDLSALSPPPSSSLSSSARACCRSTCR